MNQCTHCKAELPADTQLCSNCGTPVEQDQIEQDQHQTTLSTEAVERDTDEMEDTTKVRAVAPSELPTVRTRRVYPKVPIDFSQETWPPAGDPEESVLESTQRLTSDGLEESASENTHLAESETTIPQRDFPEPEPQPPVALHEQEASEETPQALETPLETTNEVEALAESATVLPAASPTDVSSPSIDEPAASPTDVSSPSIDEPTVGPIDASSPSITEPAVGPIDASSPSITGSVVEESTVDTIDAPATDMEERGAVPPPVTPDRWTQDTDLLPQTKPDESEFPQLAPLLPRERQVQKKSRGRVILISAIIVVLVIIAGSAGALALLHQQTSANTASSCIGQQSGCTNGTPDGGHTGTTSLTFSGAIAGPMTVSAKPHCQNATAGNLRTLTVTLSGVISGQFYNFGFAIERYNGPGTYNNATTSITVLFDLPGESTSNGWINTSSTDSGNVTVAHSEQAGTITYTLNGVGNQVGKQVQVSGNWTCA